MSRPIATACLIDPDLWLAANRRGENYWDVYYREIAEQLGLRIVAVTLADLLRENVLARFSTLLIGRIDAVELGAGAAEIIERWVRAGGHLVGSATAGLDEIFGIRHRADREQPAGPWSIAGTFSLRRHQLTGGSARRLAETQRLLALSPLRVADPVEAEAIATLNEPAGEPTQAAAITARRVGNGAAVYFSFDLAHTIWALHKGRPIERDVDGDGYFRTCDLIAIENYPVEVQYADELLWLLGRILARTGQPMISPLPPRDGRIPDLLCYWGGDDEAATNGLQRRASDFLRSRGLPYHINAMAVGGQFGLTREDAAAIQANGHEVSLHYNFHDGVDHPYAFTEVDVRQQTEAFRRNFGFDPICTVNHFVHWTGWHEPAVWMSRAGVRADNSFIHQGYPPVNPVDRLGFAFGTAFPHYFYQDHLGGNERIDFLEQPITGYEVGYAADGTDFPRLHAMLDRAAGDHLTLSLFYHPVYVAQWPTCRAAIDELVRYLAEQRIDAVHLGNDALWQWWDARHQSAIDDAREEGEAIHFRASCAYADGMIVEVPLGGVERAEVRVDGKVTTKSRRDEHDRSRLSVVVPFGDHEVLVRRGQT